MRVIPLLGFVAAVVLLFFTWTYPRGGWVQKVKQISSPECAGYEWAFGKKTLPEERDDEIRRQGMSPKEKIEDMSKEFFEKGKKGLLGQGDFGGSKWVLVFVMLLLLGLVSSLLLALLRWRLLAAASIGVAFAAMVMILVFWLGQRVDYQWCKVFWLEFAALGVAMLSAAAMARAVKKGAQQQKA